MQNLISVDFSSNNEAPMKSPIKDSKDFQLPTDIRQHVEKIPDYLIQSRDSKSNALDLIVFNFRKKEPISPLSVATIHEVVDDGKLEYFSLLKWIFMAWFCIETVVLDKKVDEQHLPRLLIDTIYLLSQELSREPVVCYEDYILMNTHQVGGRSVPLYTYTGLDDEIWFIQIHIFVEEELARVMTKLRALCKHDKALNTQSADAVQEVLQTIAESMDGAGDSLLRMIERCTPAAFLNVVRKYFAKIPKRYFVEGVSGTYAGASGAQASFEPLMDAFLGVGFVTHDPFSFHSYMPPEDRRLLKFLQANDSRSFITSLEKKDGPRAKELIRTYDAAIDAMVLFRENHIAFIGNYIPGQQGSGGSMGLKPLRDRCRDTLGMRFEKIATTPSSPEEI